MDFSNVAAAPQRPNIIIILTDEERYPVPEETAALKHFRDTQLTARKRLADTGVTFHNHYTAATACSPSRSSLFTGQYPTVHGVKETYGFAKEHDDPRIRFLEPLSIPTMGDFFRAGGYETVYKGKWHLTQEDILDENGEEIPTVDAEGKRIKEAEKLYLDQQPLEKFGFSGWIGPEPHGPKLENGGVHRDPTFSEQVGDFLTEREAKIQQGEEVKPFLLVASLVNPHDVALFPLFKTLGMELFDDTVPEVAPSPSDEEDLATKPSPQASYAKTFESVYCPPEVHQEIFSSKQEYRRMYYSLHKLVDQDIHHIYSKLQATSFFGDTIVIFTSDHGDLLGSHGNLLQKWTVAYQEAIKIPLTISAPFLPRGDVDFPTSATDILPTLLGLAGLDQEEILQQLERTHSEAHRLVGNNFAGVLQGHQPVSSQDDNVVWFMTQDEVTKGSRQVSLRGEVEYDAVEGPTSIEAVVCFLPNKETGERELWKFTRYYDDPQKWTQPFRRDVRVIRTGDRKGTTEVRTKALPDEYELYNLSRDPSELVNLAHHSVIQSLSPAERRQVISSVIVLSATLDQTSKSKRIPLHRPGAFLQLSPQHINGSLESKL